MKKYILGLFTGLVIASIISIVAYSYNAKDISFTPSNNNWNVHNVKSAIDSIKNTNDTTIANLNNQITSLQNEISSNLKGKTGDFVTTDSTTVHNISTGFRPSRIFIIIDNNRYYASIDYDTNINISRFSYKLKTSSSCDSLNTNLSDFSFSVSDTGFSYKAGNNDLVGQTYWYAIQ